MASSVLSKKIISELNPVAMIGINQFIGGSILLILGLISGGKITIITLNGVLTLAFMCLASLSAYCIWNINVKKNDLSKMFILKFTEPLFATFFSFVIHGENVMNIKYLISVLCTILAIKVSTYERNER